MVKKFLSLLVVMAMLLSLVPCIYAAEIAESGNCGADGDNLTWTLDSDGTLTISGTGKMEDYIQDMQNETFNTPWYELRDSVKEVIINDGVSSIGDCAFGSCSYLTSVTIPDSVTSIGDMAFWNCVSLTALVIPLSVTEIGEYAYGLYEYGYFFNDGKGYTAYPATLYGCAGSAAETFAAESNNGYFKTEITFIAYELNDGKASITGCEPYRNGYNGLTIFNTIRNCPLSVIYENVFEYCNGLTDIYYSGSKEEWESVEIKSGNDCLVNADAQFNSIMLPSIFAEKKNYGNFTYISLGEKVTIVGYDNQAEITEVEIPAEINGMPVTQIDSVFAGCSNLTSITIPNSVTRIGDNAFYHCESLTGITIPSSVTSIGDYAFLRCESLTNIAIPDGVTSIEDYAFHGCKSLTSTAIPDGVTSIGDYAFSGCESLTSITIPDEVTSIGDHAFSGCTSLTSITIPSSVTSIGDCAFSGEFLHYDDCKLLTEINVSENNAAYTSVDGILFNKDKTELINYPCGKIKSEYVIPDSVTSIGDRAFSSCSNLISITIPDSVTSIKWQTFYLCKSLTSITIPDSVTSIEDFAFSGCAGLKDVYYYGTEEQWKAITIGISNDCLTDATIHYETNPPASTPIPATADNVVKQFEELLSKTDINLDRIAVGVENPLPADTVKKIIVIRDMINELSKNDKKALDSKLEASQIIMDNIGAKTVGDLLSAVNKISSANDTVTITEPTIKESKSFTLKFSRNYSDIDGRAEIIITKKDNGDSLLTMTSNISKGKTDGAVSVKALSGVEKDDVVTITVKYSAEIDGKNVDISTAAVDVTVKEKGSSGSGNGGGGSSGGGSSSAASSATEKPSASSAPSVSSSPSVSDAPVSASGKVSGFTDTKEVDIWAGDAISELADAGIINGVSKTEFAPMANVTREQFVKMIVGALKIDLTDEAVTFKDIESGQYYVPYISTGVKNGIISGMSSEYFGVGQNITREDMAVIIYRALKLNETGSLNFTDAADIAEYAKTAVSVLSELGIITGYPEGNFAPKASATRAEAAVVISRVLNILNDK